MRALAAETKATVESVPSLCGNFCSISWTLPRRAYAGWCHGCNGGSIFPSGSLSSQAATRATGPQSVTVTSLEMLLEALVLIAATQSGSSSHCRAWSLSFCVRMQM